MENRSIEQINKEIMLAKGELEDFSTWEDGTLEPDWHIEERMIRKDRLRELYEERKSN